MIVLVRVTLAMSLALVLLHFKGLLHRISFIHIFFSMLLFGCFALPVLWYFAVLSESGSLLQLALYTAPVLLLGGLLIRNSFAIPLVVLGCGFAVSLMPLPAGF